jgi:ABC-type bacteriocin/lantibiotic exporter with double-glycine peptidase domain
LAIFGIAMTRVMPASNMITSFIVLLRYNKDGINKLHEHYLSPSYDNKVMTKKIVISNENRFEKISFSNVGFSYDDKRDYVTQKLSFDIQAGEAIGFIGASGSGKTTIIDLMLGLLKPTNGSIKYNDNELSECLSTWWSQVAYIPQEILLIDESIRTNIVLEIDEKEVNDDKLKKALKQARLFDFISQLPDGIETKIGEHGVRFSGGQKQRIALARAFYHDREVLILDEATSSLDSATEKEIVDEVRYLKGDKTLIIIAHRLTTLQYCDLIYEIEDGGIKNVHKYSDLIEH